MMVDIPDYIYSTLRYSTVVIVRYWYCTHTIKNIYDIFQHYIIHLLILYAILDVSMMVDIPDYIYIQHYDIQHYDIQQSL